MITIDKLRVSLSKLLRYEDRDVTIRSTELGEIYSLAIEALAARQRGLGSVPVGFVRVAIPVFVQDARRWIAWEVDRSGGGDAHGFVGLDPVESARAFARRHGGGHGDPHVVVADLPVSDVPVTHAKGIAL